MLTPDSSDRQDPQVNEACIRLIPKLQALIQQEAARHKNDPFQADEFADKMVWRLAEFLSAGKINPAIEPIPNTGQLSEAHARWYLEGGAE